MATRSICAAGVFAACVASKAVWSRMGDAMPEVWIGLFLAAILAFAFIARSWWVSVLPPLAWPLTWPMATPAAAGETHVAIVAGFWILALDLPFAMLGTAAGLAWVDRARGLRHFLRGHAIVLAVTLCAAALPVGLAVGSRLGEIEADGSAGELRERQLGDAAILAVRDLETGQTFRPGDLGPRYAGGGTVLCRERTTLREDGTETELIVHYTAHLAGAGCGAAAERRRTALAGDDRYLTVSSTAQDSSLARALARTYVGGRRGRRYDGRRGEGMPRGDLRVAGFRGRQGRAGLVVRNGRSQFILEGPAPLFGDRDALVRHLVRR